MTSVLLGEKQRNELNTLCTDHRILVMAVELFSSGYTSKEIREQAQYKQLTDRYMSQGGIQTLRIGSVLDAVVTIMKKLEA